MVNPRNFQDRGKKSFKAGNRSESDRSDWSDSDSDKEGGVLLYSPAEKKEKLAARRNIAATVNNGRASVSPPVKEHTGGASLLKNNGRPSPPKEHTGGVSLREHTGGASLLQHNGRPTPPKEHTGGVSLREHTGGASLLKHNGRPSPPKEHTGGVSLREHNGRPSPPKEHTGGASLIQPAGGGAPLKSPAESTSSESSDSSTLDGEESDAAENTNAQTQVRPAVQESMQHAPIVESQNKNGSTISNSGSSQKHIGGGPYRPAQYNYTRLNTGVRPGSRVATTGHSATHHLLSQFGQATNQGFYGTTNNNCKETPTATEATDSANKLNNREGYGGVNLNSYPQSAAKATFTQYGGVLQNGPNYAMQQYQPYQQQTAQVYVYSPAVASPAPSTVINTEFTPRASATPTRESGTPTKGGPIVQSEPRNFAPRVKGTVYDQPPPPFRAQTTAPIANGTIIAPVTAPEDPFKFQTPGKQRAAISALSPVKEQDEGQTGALVAMSSAVPPEIRARRSAHLNRLTDGPIGLPTSQDALNPANFPFMQTCSQYEPSQNGVVHIANIPFSTKVSEIVALFGRNAKIDNDINEPVHIIMERTTSKTQDAYVEFVTVEDAMKSVERMQMAIKRGRLPRLGDRPVTITLSSQCQLMKDLFPLAKGLMWVGQHPQIMEPIEGQPWTEFKGFITEEEMTMLEKHVEIPHRSPYSKECPQRPFESLISIIKKMPWNTSHLITIRQRYAVYHATYKLVELLITKIRHHREAVLPPGQKYREDPIMNDHLKKRLVRAAMLCPGFSVVQKDNIAYLAGMPEFQERGFNQPPHPELWIHAQAICPKPGFPLDVLEWYIAIIREETTRYFSQRSIQERSELDAVSKQVNFAYFGYLWSEIGYPSGPEFDRMTLREAAMLELSAIERVLKRALPVSLH